MAEAEAVGHAGDLGALVTVADERDGDAGAAGAAGAADAVHVGLVVDRRIEVDHVRDAGHVDPAGRDVGGDEHVDLAGLEAGQGDLALAL